MLSLIAVVTLAAEPVTAELPRVAVHPLITIGVDAASLDAVQSAFRVAAAREPISPVGSFAVREALAPAGGSCVGEQERPCLVRLIGTTGASYAIVASASGGDPALLQLVARVVSPEGTSTRTASASVKRSPKPTRLQLEEAFASLFAQLQLATVAPVTKTEPVVEPSVTPVEPPKDAPVVKEPALTPKSEPAPVVDTSAARPASVLRPISYAAIGLGVVAAGVGVLLMELARSGAARLPTMNGVLLDPARVDELGRIDGQWTGGQALLFGGAGTALAGLVLFFLGTPAAASEGATP